MKIKKTGQAGKSRLAEEWIYGLNPVLEAIRGGRAIKAVYIYSGRHEKATIIREESEKRGIPLKTADSNFFDSRFPKGHQGIAARVSPKAYIGLEELLNIPVKKNETPLLLVLDCIEDPRNLGAILRSAEAAGVHGVVLQSYRSVGLGPEASKASAGAVEYVPVSMVTNIKHAISEMKESGITIVGAEAGSKLSPWDIDLDIPVALVIGSEGKGLRKTVRESCDFIISLPMKGKVNSLNASVAAGILIFEILHQRTKKS